MKIHSSQTNTQPSHRIDPRLQAAFDNTNRQHFIRCEDQQLVAGHSIPSEKALRQMLSILSFPVNPKILHVGAGLGYACAVLSKVSTQVIGVEKDPEIADIAKVRLEHLHLDTATLAANQPPNGMSATICR